MNAKRIIGIIAVALVLILACVVIACVFIPKDYSFDINDPTTRIVVWKQGITPENKLEIEKSDERFEQIVSLFKQGFKSTILSSLFQGKVLETAKTLDNSYFAFNQSNMLSDNCYYIQFFYSENQSTSTHNCDITLSSSQTQYKMIAVQVNNSNALSLTHAYVGYNLTSTNICYTTFASHASLYDYIAKL